MENQTNEYYTIDLAHIFKALLNKVWVIALSGFLAAVLGCSIAAFVITPTYSSSIMLYVDNTNTAEGTKLTISSSEMAAAQDLAKTYGEILNARTTLEKVIEDTGVTYTYRELAKKIVAAPANDTEIIKVTVTTSNPEKSANIANSIARILPERVYEINQKHMVPVDYAVPEYDKVAPSITMYTIVGGFLGVFLAAMVIAIFALTNNTIHDEDYILKTHNCPILAKVPDLMDSNSKSYGYYSQEKPGDKS